MLCKWLYIIYVIFYIFEGLLVYNLMMELFKKMYFDWLWCKRIGVFYEVNYNWFLIFILCMSDLFGWEEINDEGYKFW